MAAYAGTLFIRSEAEIKRPVVLLSGARWPRHACMHACHMHAHSPAAWREGQAWAGLQKPCMLLQASHLKRPAVRPPARRRAHQCVWRAGKALQRDGAATVGALLARGAKLQLCSAVRHSCRVQGNAAATPPPWPSVGPRAQLYPMPPPAACPALLMPARCACPAQVRGRWTPALETWRPRVNGVQLKVRAPCHQ